MPVNLKYNYKKNLKSKYNQIEYILYYIKRSMEKKLLLKSIHII